MKRKNGKLLKESRGEMEGLKKYMLK